MSDIIDDANDQAARYLAAALRLQEAKSHQPTIYYAECLFCAADTEEGAPYCSKDCRDDHERLLDSRKRNGGA